MRLTDHALYYIKRSRLKWPFGMVRFSNGGLKTEPFKIETIKCSVSNGFGIWMFGIRAPTVYHIHCFFCCFVIFVVTINKVLFIFLSFFKWSFRKSIWTCLFVEASQRSDVMRIYGSMNRFDPLATPVRRIILNDRLEFHQDRIDAAGVSKLQKKPSLFSNNN